MASHDHDSRHTEETLSARVDEQSSALHYIGVFQGVPVPQILDSSVINTGTHLLATQDSILDTAKLSDGTVVPQLHERAHEQADTDLLSTTYTIPEADVHPEEADAVDTSPKQMVSADEVQLGKLQQTAASWPPPDQQSMPYFKLYQYGAACML